MGICLFRGLPPPLRNPLLTRSPSPLLTPNRRLLRLNLLPPLPHPQLSLAVRPRLGRFWHFACRTAGSRLVPLGCPASRHLSVLVRHGHISIDTLARSR